jgi:hypothetical protein
MFSMTGAPNALTSVTIPSTVLTMGKIYYYCILYLLQLYTGTYAFNYRFAITSLTLVSGLVSLGDYAFQYNHGIPALTIPSTIKTVGN